MDDVMEIRITQHDPATGQLPLWPDSVDAFYTDAACTIRSPLTRRNWGYTYRRLEGQHPDKPLAGFTTDDLVAYVTQRDDVGARWAPLTARNYRIALSSPNSGLLIGIPDLRPHDLRRTLAGLLDSQGARLQDIRQVLRHDRLATTEAYLVDNPRRLEARMRVLTLPSS